MVWGIDILSLASILYLATHHPPRPPRLRIKKLIMPTPPISIRIDFKTWKERFRAILHLIQYGCVMCNIDEDGILSTAESIRIRREASIMH